MTPKTKRRLKWSVKRLDSGEDYTVTVVCGKWVSYLWRGLNVDGEWHFAHNSKREAVEFCEKHAKKKGTK